MAEAPRDQNRVTTLLGVNDITGETQPIRINAAGEILVSATGGSGGDVNGPGASTDNAVVRWDGVTGTFIQDSLVIISDLGAVTGITTLVASGSIRSNTAFILEETGVGIDTITLQAPASIATSYTLTLPVDDGAVGEFLQTDGSGTLAWATPAGAGNVSGPGASTDNAIVRWDGATGTLIKNSGVFISNGGQLQIIAGTETVPGLAIIGDLDTGIYSPGAGLLNVTLNGADLLSMRGGSSIFSSAVAIEPTPAAFLPVLNSSSPYLSVVLGSQTDAQFDGSGNGSTISSARFGTAALPPTLAPFTVLGGYDFGSASFVSGSADTGRINYYGGGGWIMPDTNNHQFYTAPTYSETTDLGVLALHIASTTQIRANLGTAAIPTWSILTDTDTGIFSPSANQLAVSTGGTQRFTVSTTAITSTLPFLGPVGSVTAPTYSFSTDTNTGMFQNGVDILNLVTGGTTRVSFTALGNALFTNRVEQAKGANVASTGNLTLGSDGNTFTITGTTQINAITTTNWTAGSHITLIFSGALTFKHNTAGGGGTAPIFLAGSVDMTTAANSIVGLVFDGTQWQETFRKVA